MTLYRIYLWASDIIFNLMELLVEIGMQGECRKHLPVLSSFMTYHRVGNYTSQKKFCNTWFLYRFYTRKYKAIIDD